MTMRMLLALAATTISLSGCASLELPEASDQFQSTPLLEEAVQRPQMLPEPPFGETVDDDAGSVRIVLSASQAAALMDYIEAAEDNQRLCEANTDQLLLRKQEINRYIQMGRMTEREAAMFRNGWLVEYQIAQREVWMMRVVASFLVLGMFAL